MVLERSRVVVFEPSGMAEKEQGELQADPEFEDFKKIV